MENEFIDVDYEEVTQKSDDDDKNVTINTDPLSAALSGITSIANNITNAVKEYNMCRQQEQTKRTAIKAQMKVELEKIHSKEKLFLNAMNNQHKENMQRIQNYREKFKQVMLIVSEAIDSAIKISEQSGDYSEVCRLIELNCSVMERINDMEIKNMKASNNLLDGNDIAGLLK